MNNTESAGARLYDALHKEKPLQIVGTINAYCSILAEKAGSVLGVDISENAVKFARETYDRGNTTYKCSDLNKLSFAENSFDVVVSIETLEHVEESVCLDFLKKISGWIKPGATVIDVGINRIGAPEKGEGKSRLAGDVNFAEALSVAGAITPVPGGVGPMTIACLLRNTLLAACRQRGVVESDI